MKFPKLFIVILVSSLNLGILVAQVPESPAPANPNATSPQRGAAEEEPELDTYLVTGSRIRGLVGEATMQPVLSLDTADIERTGATSLGEVLRFVPQVSSYDAGLFVQSPFAFGASSGNSTTTRVTANLRGAPPGGTLLLINGRRAPRNGQELAGLDGYDISGIPLAAVERIEVLLDGASAIYGADAVGGVINIILKRRYQGTDLRISYENTFDTDAHVFTSSLTHGFGYGNLSGLLTVSYEKSGNLMWVDRDFLRTQDRREWGGSNVTTFQIPGANGSITAVSGQLPGVGSNVVTIPAGANGTNMTVADYAANVGAPPGSDPAIWASYDSPFKRRSLVGMLEYEFTENLSGFFEFRASDSRTEQFATPLALNNLVLPADAPGNVFGVPVRMRRYLLDIPNPPRVSENRNLSQVLGLRMNLPGGWRAEASVSNSTTRPEFMAPLGFSAVQTNFNDAMANPDPAQRPNLFYDSVGGFNPNPDGLLESLAQPSRSLEKGTTRIFEVTADGPLYTIWSGDIRMAVGAEYREEKVDFPLQSPTDQFSARARNRYPSGIFTELRIPLVSHEQAIPFIDRLELSAAIRHDRYKEFDNSTTPRYGLLYRPTTWIAIRGSYGEGYKVPTLHQLYSPVRDTQIFFSIANPPLDPMRGDEPITQRPFPIIAGGNPNLVPEETESRTAGIVIEVPGQWFQGLFLTYDHYDHRYINRISPSLGLADRMALFPELFERGPNLPDDPAGWPGPIIRYDNRAVNVAVNRITGWDAGIRYFRQTGVGDFTLNANASKAYRNENRPIPGAPPATNAVPESLPLQASGSLYWRLGAIETGALFSYRDKFKRNLNERITPSAIRWDWRVTYDFDRNPRFADDRSTFMKRALANTRLSLSIINVFDVEPPMSSAGLPNSSLIDARGRRYVVSYSKSFGN